MRQELGNKDSRSFEEIEDALRASGRIFCPKCLSTSFVTSDARPTNMFPILTDNLARLVHALLRITQQSTDTEKDPLCTCETCGFRWHRDRRYLYDRYSRCLKKYFGNYYRSVTIGAAEGARITIDISGVYIYHSEKKYVQIPFEELAGVSFQKNIGPLYGWLAFRDLARRNRRFPRTFKDAGKDVLTIYYGLGDDNTFGNIYMAMKEIVEENRRAEVI